MCLRFHGTQKACPFEKDIRTTYVMDYQTCRTHINTLNSAIETLRLQKEQYQLTTAPNAKAAANPRASAIPPDARNGTLSSFTARASLK